MKKELSVFLLAVLAGVSIGIGGTVFLSVENRIAGALLFAVGLYTICVHGLNLFTGKVGYAVDQPRAYWLDLAVIWCGNLAGTALAGAGVRASRIAPLAEKAAQLCQPKLADGMGSLFVLGIFCGLLMYAAVEGYKKARDPLLLFACVAAFILCGFEHCIADMFYFSAAGLWSPDALARILVITAGNAAGGMLIPLAKKYQA